MNAILNNPFRILGLLASASSREINSRVNKLLMYIEAENELPRESDCGFPEYMGEPLRTTDSVNRAKADLNLDDDRARHSLLWFIVGDASVADEPGFEALRNGDADTAVNLWRRIADQPTTANNCSAQLNLSTLYILQASLLRKPDMQLLEKGLKMKLQLLESDGADIFFRAVTDENYIPDISKIELWLLAEIDAMLKSKQSQIISSTNSTRQAKHLTLSDIMLSMPDFAAKEQYMKSAANKEAEEISGDVQTCVNFRKSAPKDAMQAAATLRKAVVPKLEKLEKRLGRNDLLYGKLADEVASEICNCAVNASDYWENEVKEMSNSYLQRSQTVSTAKALISAIKPLLASLKQTIEWADRPGVKPLEEAKALAVSSAIKQRCDKNREIIETNFLSFSTQIGQVAFAFCFEEFNNASASQKAMLVVSTIQLVREILEMDLEDEFRKRLMSLASLMDNKDNSGSRNVYDDSTTRRIRAEEDQKRREAEARRKFEEQKKREELERQEAERRRQEAEAEARRIAERRRQKLEEKARRRAQRIRIFGWGFSGSKFWAAVQWTFWLSLIVGAILFALEYFAHAITAPATKYLKSLPYTTTLAWFFYLSWGITSLFRRKYRMLGVFLRFLANALVLYLFWRYYPEIRGLDSFTTLDKISLSLLAFLALLHATMQVHKTMQEFTEKNFLSKLQGKPLMLFSYSFYTSLFVPLLFAAIMWIGGWLPLSKTLSDICWCYGFLLVYSYILSALNNNCIARRYSKGSTFLQMQHRMLFLPEAAAFLIWYFEWTPLPRWVTIAFIVYGVLWLFATINLLLSKNKED